MAAGSFDRSLAFVLKQEGGYVDDPRDPGGATNMGITLATLTAWRHSAVTKQDVQNLTVAEAAAIYRTKYWNALQCDALPAGVDLMLFDCGVNAGPARSAKFLQAGLGLSADGAIGPQTITAATAADQAHLINDLAKRRLDYYRSLPAFDHFGGGWTARVNDALPLALSIAGIG